MSQSLSELSLKKGGYKNIKENGNKNRERKRTKGHSYVKE